MNPPPDIYQLGQDPQLAVLWTLMANLDAARVALMASNPELWCEEHYKYRPTVREAYASAIIHQGDALRIMLDEYFESVERARQFRGRESGRDDVEF